MFSSVIFLALDRKRFRTTTACCVCVCVFVCSSVLLLFLSFSRHPPIVVKCDTAGIYLLLSSFPSSGFQLFTFSSALKFVTFRFRRRKAFSANLRPVPLNFYEHWCKSKCFLNWLLANVCELTELFQTSFFRDACEQCVNCRVTI